LSCFARAKFYFTLLWIEKDVKGGLRDPICSIILKYEGATEEKHYYLYTMQ
jgi:hypothetical protein